MALLPPSWLDAVVAIGAPTNSSIQWLGSGFLYGDYIGKSSDTEHTYAIYLVTARHVLDGRNGGVVLRFNPEAADRAKEYHAALTTPLPNARPIWVAHPDQNVDVAVVRLNATLLKEQGLKHAFFRSDCDVLLTSGAEELGVSEGDGIFVLGFPLGLVGEGRNFVIVRQGTLARIRDTLARATKTFLIDAPVFPGNSGGPIITRPELTAIQGTKPQNQALLLGVVASFIPYQDVAVSLQTKRPRITFEENSGLAHVFPMDFVKETIEKHQKLFPPTAQPDPRTTA